MMLQFIDKRSSWPPSRCSPDPLPFHSRLHTICISDNDLREAYDRMSNPVLFYTSVDNMIEVNNNTPVYQISTALIRPVYRALLVLQKCIVFVWVELFVFLGMEAGCLPASLPLKCGRMRLLYIQVLVEFYTSSLYTVLCILFILTF